MDNLSFKMMGGDLSLLWNLSSVYSRHILPAEIRYLLTQADYLVHILGFVNFLRPDY